MIVFLPPQKEKSTIQSVINVIGSTINSVKTNISDISTKVNNLTTNLATLANDHDALKIDFNKKIVYTAYNQAKAYGRYKTIEVAGNSNTYYPVAILCTQRDNSFPVFLGCGKHLESKTASYSGNHSGGTSSMSYWWVMRQGGWDGNAAMVRTIWACQPYANLIAKAELGMSSYYGMVLWLRGGGTVYNLSCSDDFTVNIYYTTTNLGSSSYPWNVVPTTEIGNKGVCTVSNGLSGTIINP